MFVEYVSICLVSIFINTKINSSFRFLDLYRLVLYLVYFLLQGILSMHHCVYLFNSLHHPLHTKLVTGFTIASYSLIKTKTLPIR